MKLRFHDYRYAGSVLDHSSFGTAKAEIVDILQKTSVPLLDPSSLDPNKGGVKRRRRSPLAGDTRYRYFFLPVDQKKLNGLLDSAFRAAGWTPQPLIVDPARSAGPATKLRGDFKKGRLEVEIQFGNMARWYTDVFKFQLSYSLDSIDAAVLVVATQHFANLIDENVAYYERVCRELPWAKMSLTLPIWVIGVEPEDYQAIRECYDKAAARWVEDQGPDRVVPISFTERIAEEPRDEEPNT